MAMFINHSCDANCETSEEDGRVWIKAIRKIAAGEEITYDYCLYDGGDDEAICNCGAKNCRGTMYSKEEVLAAQGCRQKGREEGCRDGPGEAQDRQEPQGEEEIGARIGSESARRARS